jgi:hypothetical protein
MMHPANHAEARLHLRSHDMPKQKRLYFVTTQSGRNGEVLAKSPGNAIEEFKAVHFPHMTTALFRSVHQPRCARSDKKK